MPGTTLSPGQYAEERAMTAAPLTLLAILAHPDDESMGVGGTLVKYASEGVETHLVCATRGEVGWFGPPADYPGPFALGQIREQELHAAADVLGIRSVRFLDECDGQLDRSPTGRLIARIVTQIRDIRPDVVITFGPDGAYGHPDHIAISQLTTTAVMAANDVGYLTGALLPHQVQKLYYMAFRAEEIAIYQEAFGELAMEIDGSTRRSVTWPDWAVTTHLDTTDHWRQVWQAILCHRTQLPGIDALTRLPEAKHRALWGNQTFYRALSFVNGGRAVEDDLFAGLRGNQVSPWKEGIIF
jgi:LmbE family N-acetylglucosaminyl deacetylase